jgi:hypothetical protein
MDGSENKRRLALAMCLFLLGLSGCKGGGLWTGSGLFGKASDEVPGIMSPPERTAAIRKMAQEARGPDAQEALARKFAALYPREGDPLIRAELVRAVSPLRCPTAGTLLREATKDNDADVRIDACKGLEGQVGPETTAALAEVLASDTDPDVRLTAARALGQTRDPAAVSALGSALEDQDPAMQYRAVSSLRKVAPQDLGDDVDRWRQYVKGQPPSPPKPVSLAEQIRRMLY